MEKLKEGISIENTEKINFEVLRHQVELIKKEEMVKKEKGEYHDPHFDFIEPSKLIEEDLAIFYKFLEKKLTRKDFYKYQVSGEKGSSRLEFKAWLGNKLQVEEWFDPELKGWKDSIKI